VAGAGKHRRPRRESQRAIIGRPASGRFLLQMEYDMPRLAETVRTKFQEH
jgi:hypothetical protein